MHKGPIIVLYIESHICLSLKHEQMNICDIIQLAILVRNALSPDNLMKEAVMGFGCPSSCEVMLGNVTLFFLFELLLTYTHTLFHQLLYASNTPAMLLIHFISGLNKRVIHLHYFSLMRVVSRDKKTKNKYVKQISKACLLTGRLSVTPHTRALHSFHYTSPKTSHFLCVTQ